MSSIATRRLRAAALVAVALVAFTASPTVAPGHAQTHAQTHA
jgi:hypothetical protein